MIIVYNERKKLCVISFQKNIYYNINITQDLLEHLDEKLYNYSKKYNHFIIGSHSEEILNYWQPIIQKYSHFIFIASSSTSIYIRQLELPNLYFTLESNQTFLPKAFFNSIFNPTKHCLIIDKTNNNYYNEIKQYAKSIHVKIILSNDIQNNLDFIKNATLIYIVTYDNITQTHICNSISNEIKGVVIFVEYPPFSLENLNKMEKTIRVGLFQQSIVTTISNYHPWNMNLKRSYLSLLSSDILCLFSLFYIFPKWEKYLIRSKILSNHKNQFIS